MNNSNNCSSCETTCSSCGRPWAICKQEGGCSKPTCQCQKNFCCGSIQQKTTASCPDGAVIPSITVEKMSQIKGIYGSFVHVAENNTTLYIDDNGRAIITWQGGVEVSNYDVETNPLRFRSQVLISDGRAYYFDSQGKSTLLNSEVGANIIPSYSSYRPVTKDSDVFSTGATLDIIESKISEEANVRLDKDVELERRLNVLTNANVSAQGRASLKRWYKLTTLKASNDLTSADTLRIEGRIGGYSSLDVGQVNVTIAGRDGVRAYGDYYYRGAKTNFYSDIIAYKNPEDGTVAIYLYVFDYYAIEFEMHFRGCANQYDGTFVEEEPSGERIWSLSQDSSLDTSADCPNFFFFVGFDNDSSAKTRYFVSGDGINFNEISLPKNFGGRDPSIAYDKVNHVFYLTHTTSSSTSVKIWTSNDLENWTEHTSPISGIHTTGRTWAPDLFIDDNGDLYVVITSQYGEEEDITGATIPAFDTFIAKCNDKDALTFNTAYRVILPSTTRNYIDGSLSKINGYYVLCIKNEYSKKTEVFTSSDLVNFVQVNENLTGTSLMVEGQQLIPYQDKVLYMADCFTNSVYISSSTNKTSFPSFNEKFNVCKGLDTKHITMRHGSCIYVDDQYVKNLLYRKNGFSLGESPFAINPKRSVGANISSEPYKFENYAPLPGTVLYLYGGRNQNISIKNIFNESEMKISFAASSGITLKVDSIDGVAPLRETSITNNSSSNEKIYKIDLSSTEELTHLDGDISAKELTQADLAEYLSPNFELRESRLVRMNGTVYMRLQLSKKSGYAGASWDTVMTLPVGYRPILSTMLNTDSDNIDKRLQISSNGEIHFDTRSFTGSPIICGTWLGLR